ncbi:MAG TPA: 4Fe-4S binding protein [Burkholderiales bacterium]
MTNPDPGISLPQETRDGRARIAALAAAGAVEPRPTSLVSYRSTGALVIIGPEAGAVAAAKRLAPALRCTVVVQKSGTPQADAGEWTAHTLPPEIAVLREKVIQVTGHLGQYAVIVAAPPPEGGVNLLQKLGSQRTHFDLVLDLCTPPFIDDELLPFGYYAPAGDADKLERALAELPEMVGEFEKPRFFNYNAEICAHGANGLTGCTRCIDVCPAGAIISMREEVAVDPYKCQGAGACATACPTGAMTYVYPTVADHLAKLGAALSAYREAGGERPVILYYDAEAGRARMRALAPQLPEHVVPLEIAEIGSVGMDVWLAALAYGAGGVCLLPTYATPRRVCREVEAQLGYARLILEGMGYEPASLAMLPLDDADALATIAAFSAAPLAPAASFAVFNEKRVTLRLAIEHLYAHAPQPRREIALPAGAPFGRILVNRDACTLCMACVGACPAGALNDGGDLPQLRFIEDNCVQCGLCQTTCPEGAIALEARYLYDPEARRTPRVMHEEAPFHCISCGRPFATGRMMSRMTEKLQGHWMFQSAEALRRIQMCADCRVRDMFEAEARRHEAK